MKKKKVIIFTGGTGRFVSEFKKIKNNFKVYYPSKRKVDILKFHSIIRFIKEKNLTILFIALVYLDLCLFTIKKLIKV